MGPRMDELFPTLQLAYTESNKLLESAYHDEMLRRLRVDAAMVQDECDDLREALSQSETRAEALEQTHQETERRLTNAHLKLTRAEEEITKRARDLGLVKEELHSLREIDKDSKKCLTEKLSLNRELCALRPEVEHLRTQSATFQAVVSEKLALERQISSLEVELDNEKRIGQRHSAKKPRATSKLSQGEVQTEVSQSETKADRLGKETAVRAAQWMSTGKENQPADLQKRPERPIQKMRSPKDNLKVARATVKLAPKTGAVEAVSSSSITARRASPEPEDERVQKKKHVATPPSVHGKRRNAFPNVGEKSSFSITPFLAKSAHFVDASKETVSAETLRPDLSFTNPHLGSRTSTLQSSGLHGTSNEKDIALEEQSADFEMPKEGDEIIVRRLGGRKHSFDRRMREVDGRACEGILGAGNVNNNLVRPKPRKRLFQVTRTNDLFDKGPESPDEPQACLAAALPLPLLNKENDRGAANDMKKRQGFGAISPLKRQKRAVKG